MNMQQLTEAIYRLVARLDDDPWIDHRIKEHAHLLRQEIKAVHPDIDQSLPPSGTTTRAAG